MLVLLASHSYLFYNQPHHQHEKTVALILFNLRIFKLSPPKNQLESLILLVFAYIRFLTKLLWISFQIGYTFLNSSTKSGSNCVFFPSKIRSYAASTDNADR